MSGGFESMGLAPEIQRAVEELGYTLPTEVQDEAIPLILGGGDVMVAAPTGSGKTAAFALPILELVHQKLREAPSAKRARKQETMTVALSAEDRDAAVAIGPDGLTMQSRSDRWCGARAAVGVASEGRFYFEVTVQDEGLVRVGVSTSAGSLDLGTDGQGVGYGGTAKKSHAKTFEDYGETYGKGDVVGCALDLAKSELRFSKNGLMFEPIVLPLAMRGQVLFPTIAMRNAEATLALACKCPEGYVAFADAPLQSKEHDDGPGTGGHALSAIVLEPARDLAEQTHQCFESYARYLDSPQLKCALLIGGCDTRADERALKAGDVDVLTATPVKLLDVIKRGTVDLSSTRFFVLDEADRFIETEDVKTVMEIFERLPKQAESRERRLQVAFFSATLHSESIKELAAQLCEAPTWVDLKGPSHLPDTVHHVVLRVDPTSAPMRQEAVEAQKSPKKFRTDGVHRSGDLACYTNLPDLTDKAAEMSETVKLAKARLLVRLADKLQMEQCMVFCRTNLDTDLLEKFLNECGGSTAFKGARDSGKESRYSCCVLGGARAMQERRRNLEAFKEGNVRFLICTDVAARGIDVRGLPYVVNMTLPDTEENYVHRVGRVGRAERTGLAISLVATVKERVWFCAKGKKPPQKDTRDFSQGGNCVWYDEPALIGAVQKRLGAPIREMDPVSLDLPEGIAGLTFGDAAAAGEDKASSRLHVEAIVEDVAALREMETRAQRNYFALLMS